MCLSDQPRWEQELVCTAVCQHQAEREREVLGTCVLRETGPTTLDTMPRLMRAEVGGGTGKHVPDDARAL